jgi:hypothetical protein
LLDLAEGAKFAAEFLAVVKEKYVPLHISPTAFIELEFLAKQGTVAQRRAATNSITSLHKWGVMVFDLSPVEHGYTKEFADRLIRKGYLSSEEYHDGLILGEVGCFGIPILVTSDDHLLGIPQSAVTAESKASDFSATVIVSPQRIVRIASRS